MFSLKYVLKCDRLWLFVLALKYGSNSALTYFCSSFLYDWLNTKEEMHSVCKYNKELLD